MEAKFESVEINGNVLIMSSTGFQMGHATEYVEYRHKLRRRKKCYKFHIITDEKRIIEVESTTSNIGDTPVFREMFERLRNVLGGMGG